MKEQTINLINVVLAIVVIFLLGYLIHKSCKDSKDEEQRLQIEMQQKLILEEQLKQQILDKEQVIKQKEDQISELQHPTKLPYLKKEDYSTCSKLSNQFCGMIKNGKVNNLLQPASSLLKDIKDACGNTSHIDLSHCYPKWATVRGGTHMANLYPMLATLEK